MKTIFSIGDSTRTGNTLLFEIGPDYCCYAYADIPKKTFQFIQYLSFNETETEEAITALIKGIARERFENVVCCPAYSQALLVPQQMSAHAALLDSIYAGHQDALKVDPVPEWQLNNAYALPAAIHDLFMNSFPSVQFVHAFTPALKIYNGFVAPDQVDIHFTIQYFRVLVKKDNQVQLAQTYAYKTPLDVVYYLLKICYEFGLDQKEMFLIVSGLIEKDSALYLELHNYFLNLHFAHAPEYAVPHSEHPHYYFTSLYNLAACAS